MVGSRTSGPGIALFAFASVAASSAMAGHKDRDDCPPDNDSHAISVELESNTQPKYVSGGDVLLRVEVPQGAGRVIIELNDTDVTSSFASQNDGSLLGLVKGLHDGVNHIEARSASAHGQRGAPGQLTIVNHPITGPLFSGPQQVWFRCDTQSFGLAAATLPLCSAPTQVTYQYRKTTGSFAPLADPSVRPADLATATVNGMSVPYIVRVERGTIDRAVYEISSLYSGQDPNPLAPNSSWNGKLVYTFGGGGGPGYRQGASTGGVLNDLFLSRGYAVASSTLNVNGNYQNTIVSAEAAMMVKEHFIEEFGPVQHTIGWGGSGGAISQYDIADAYPGILDGIIPGISFSDNITLSTASAHDCGLLNNYFASTALTYTPAQIQAIVGYGGSQCASYGAFSSTALGATAACNPIVPVSAQWNPVTNPNGVRCSIWDIFENQLGRDRASGFVRRGHDNVGVQYGLEALKSGKITAQQFVDLNTRIGGYDRAGNLIPDRTVADEAGLREIYRSDLALSARQGLATTPVIDQRTYLDNATNANNVHVIEWSFITRARMIEAGTAANQVIIESSPALTNTASVYELDAMDRWLTAIESDESDTQLRDKIVANKPADLADGCYLPTGQRITEYLGINGGTGQCATLFPIFSNPRGAAGQRKTLDILKCHLAPIRFSSYPVTFTDAQRVALKAAFPNGVCDYQRLGVGQVPPGGTWLNYSDGPSREHWH